ncbi:MAG: hypothetical protein R3F19_11255 [Verrucomicrobiales bacterium]
MSVPIGSAGEDPEIGKNVLSKAPIANAQLEQEQPSHRWRLSLGAAYRSIGDVHFVSEFRAPSLHLPSLFGDGFRRVPAIGDLSSPVDREYSDGYVRPDAGTPADGTTGYWGYQNASQVNGDSLNFNASGSQRIVSNQTEGVLNQLSGEELDSWSPVIQLDYVVIEREAFSVAARVGFMYSVHDFSTLSSRAVALQGAEDFRLDFSDSYDLQGVIPPLAPYEGSSIGPGPLIDASPTTRSHSSSLIQTQRGEYASTLRQDFDMKLATLSDGVVIEFGGDRLTGFLSAGVTLNIADWSAETGEQVTLTENGTRRDYRRWKDSAAGTELGLGVYAEAGTAVALTDRISIAGFGRYDWADSFDAKFGRSQIHVDLGGWSAGVTLRVDF